MWNRISQRLSDPLFYRKRWRQLVRPFAPPRPPRPVGIETLLERDGPALAILAHPDDELFSSCLLCELAAREKPAEILCLTRGEGGIQGDAAREELGRVREAELRASAAALGVREVAFLGHVDPPAKSHRVYAPAVSIGDLAADLRRCIADRRPAFLLSHGSGGEYWHPAHVLLHRAVLLARGGTPMLTLHAWQENHPLAGLLNRDDPADLVIDGTPHRERRLAAFRAHHTQFAYFARHGGGSLERYVDLTAREAHCLRGGP